MTIFDRDEDSRMPLFERGGSGLLGLIGLVGLTGLIGLIGLSVSLV